MGEFHGQILGMVIVIAIFAAITPVMVELFGNLANDVVKEAETYIDDPTAGTPEGKLNVGGHTIELMSYAD